MFEWLVLDDIPASYSQNFCSKHFLNCKIAISKQTVGNIFDIIINRRFNAIVSQLKMHYFSGGAFKSLIASQLLKKEKYI